MVTGGLGLVISICGLVALLLIWVAAYTLHEEIQVWIANARKKRNGASWPMGDNLDADALEAQSMDLLSTTLPARDIPSTQDPDAKPHLTAKRVKLDTGKLDSIRAKMTRPLAFFSGKNKAPARPQPRPFLLPLSMASAPELSRPIKESSSVSGSETSTGTNKPLPDVPPCLPSPTEDSDGWSSYFSQYLAYNSQMDNVLSALARQEVASSINDPTPSTLCTRFSWTNPFRRSRNISVVSLNDLPTRPDLPLSTASDQASTALPLGWIVPREQVNKNKESKEEAMERKLALERNWEHGRRFLPQNLESGFVDVDLGP